MDEMLSMGCWTRLERFSIADGGAHWHPKDATPAGRAFDVWFEQCPQGRVEWGCPAATISAMHWPLSRLPATQESNRSRRSGR